MYITAHAQGIEQLLCTSLPAVLVCPGGGLGGSPGGGSEGGTVQQGYQYKYT